MPDVRPTLAFVVVAVLVGCAGPSPSPSAASTPTASPATPAPSDAPPLLPSATPEPPLSLAPPDETDARTVTFEVTPQLPADGDGTLTVSVTNDSGERIDELVLRWPTALDATLFLAPFVPDPGRIADGGPPLNQPWTKWVVGPGERGEPAETTSLGWGPLDPGATLEIPIVVTRRAAGPVSFDLQILAGNAILDTAGGNPAETRVAIP
ncbi:MAG: hypothetical protein ABI534_09550 [Chloroflexota bacterium]